MVALMVFAQQVERAVRRQTHWANDFVALLRVWWNRSRGRQELMMMTDRELRDLGIKRSDVLYEARKPFWRP